MKLWIVGKWRFRRNRELGLGLPGRFQFGEESRGSVPVLAVLCGAGNP